jgi:hypothetical protein
MENDDYLDMPSYAGKKIQGAVTAPLTEDSFNSPFFMRHFHESKKKFDAGILRDVDDIEYLLDDLTVILKQGNLIKNDEEFSHLMGKKNSYYSVLKARGRPISLDGLFRLVVNLSSSVDDFERAAISEGVDSDDWKYASAIRQSIHDLMTKLLGMVDGYPPKWMADKDLKSWI